MLETDEKRNQRLLSYCNKEVEAFVGYCETQLKKTLKYEPLSYIGDLDSPWGMNFDGVTVISNEDFTEFEVGHEMYSPGTYWQPPDSDYTPYSKHERLTDALWDVFVLWLKFDYTNFLESQWAEECVAEMEEE